MFLTTRRAAAMGFVTATAGLAVFTGLAPVASAQSPADAPPPLTAEQCHSKGGVLVMGAGDQGGTMWCVAALGVLTSSSKEDEGEERVEP
ncbi:hypothetical protein [Streptomyces sp. NPDC000410]|uniref:hypothetical protein n=1 Tax=Streptomyces sp. NPDC000410 TaxID=3154254 RepID=UPI003332FC42